MVIDKESPYFQHGLVCMKEYQKRLAIEDGTYLSDEEFEKRKREAKAAKHANWLRNRETKRQENRERQSNGGKK